MPVYRNNSRADHTVYCQRCGYAVDKTKSYEYWGEGITHKPEKCVKVLQEVIRQMKVQLRRKKNG